MQTAFDGSWGPGYLLISRLDRLLWTLPALRRCTLTVLTGGAVTPPKYFFHGFI
jgi:hypothetical protein